MAINNVMSIWKWYTISLFVKESNVCNEPINEEMTMRRNESNIQ